MWCEECDHICEITEVSGHGVTLLALMMKEDEVISANVLRLFQLKNCIMLRSLALCLSENIFDKST